MEPILSKRIRVNVKEDAVVEEEILVKTLYNSGSEGWATFGDLGRIFVGTLLGSVMFTCDVFFEFVACLSGLVPVATQWLTWGCPERLCSDTSVTSVENHFSKNSSR